jgi:transcriptional regulator with XRE-family HTH domain
MTTSDMIRELCDRMNISLAELCRRIGQTPQNFNKKLKRDTLSLKELIAIADVLYVSFEQSFVLENGKEIKIGNRTDCF